jgi:hypothetical protein
LSSSAALSVADYGKEVFVALQLSRVARDEKKWSTTQAAYRARLRQEKAWADTFEQISIDLLSRLNLQAALTYARSEQRPSIFVRKALSEEELLKRLTAEFDLTSWEQGAVRLYIGLALHTGETAGQYALERLGLNQTFSWADVRSMAQDQLAMRGSKIIQSMYGNHLNRLSELITEATKPDAPETIAAVEAKIIEEWPKLTRFEAERIARTETAAVWTSTSMNTYAANGVKEWESLVAQGPSIGINSFGACDLCIERAAGSPFPIDYVDMPPWHPNCRCEAIPVLADDWLPPMEPFAGGTIENLIGDLGLD